MADTGSNWISSIRWDERGPYRILLMGPDAGQKRYVAPAEVNPLNTSDPKLLQWAAANQRPGQSLLKNAGTWNSETGDWDRGTNWTNIANMGVGAFLGGPALANAFGGGSGAASAAGGGTLPASSVPVSAAMHGPAAIASQGVSAGLPATAPLGGVAANAATQAGSGGILKKIADLAGNPATQIAMAAGLPLLTGMGPGGGSGTPEIPDELKRYLGLSEARIRRVDPLHQAATQMAFQGLPTYGRQGITLNKVDLP